MANDPTTRMFTVDATILGYTQGGVVNNVFSFFRDATLNIEVEHASSWSPGDTISSVIQGVTQNKFKARAWSLDLNANMVSGGVAPANRQFGWNITTAALGGVDVFGLSTNMEFSSECQMMDARVPTDTLAVADDGVGGWRYPRVKSRTWELGFTGRVIKGTDVFAQNPFELMLGADPTDMEGIDFELTSPGVNIAGTGTLGSGSLSFPEEAVEQSLRIVGDSAPPTITGAPFLSAIWSLATVGGAETTRSQVLAVRLQRPGGPASGSGLTLTGTGFFTSVRGTITDDANVETGTITGYGPIGLGS